MPTRKRSATLNEAREEKMTRIILASIRHELRDVEFFTREDLLQLRPLQSVATITRYHWVCLAMSRCIVAKQVYAVSRTELCLAGRTVAAKTNSGANLFENYMHTVRRLVTHHDEDHPGQPFDVMDLVAAWKQDQHLTTNAKRVAVRVCLRRLAKERAIIQQDNLAYAVPQPNITRLKVVNGNGNT